MLLVGAGAFEAARIITMPIYAEKVCFRNRFIRALRELLTTVYFAFDEWLADREVWDWSGIEDAYRPIIGSYSFYNTHTREETPVKPS
jgi:hypothetical protein